MSKYAIVLRVWGNTVSKYYNNYQTGEILLFDQKADAEKFKNKLEKESGSNISYEVTFFKSKNKKKNIFDTNFIERIGSKIN